MTTETHLYGRSDLSRHADGPLVSKGYYDLSRFPTTVHGITETDPITDTHPVEGKPDYVFRVYWGGDLGNKPWTVGDMLRVTSVEERVVEGIRQITLVLSAERESHV